MFVLELTRSEREALEAYLSKELYDKGGDIKKEVQNARSKGRTLLEVYAKLKE